MRDEWRDGCVKENTGLVKLSMLCGEKKGGKMGGLPRPESTWMSGRSSRGSGGTQGTERQGDGRRGG